MSEGPGRTGRPGRRALVIHPGAVGDVLLAAPALAHLRGLGYDPVLAATARVAALLAGTGLVEGTCDLDGLGLHALFVEGAAPAALAPLRGHDAVVSWLGAGDAGFVATLRRLGVPVVVARAAPPDGAPGHAADHLLRTLAPLGPVPARAPRVRLAIDPADRAWAEAWLAARGLAAGDAVLLHPGAGSPAKVWPGFGRLGRRLVERGAAVVLSVGEADGEVGRRVAAEAGLDETRVARELPLRRLAALAGAARAFVGNDSGPTHLAALVGCPTAALFGPTDPARWAPRGGHVRVVAGGGPAVAAPWAGVEVADVEAALAGLTGPGPARLAKRMG